MITDALLDILFGAGEWFVGLLPVMPTVDCSGLSAGGWLSWVGSLVDLPVLAACLSTIIGVELAIWAVQGVIWLYKKIPLT